MKKLFLLIGFSLLAIPTLASVQSTTCGSIGSGIAGCGACFKETQTLYTCNPYQASCQKQAIAGLSDTATNASGGDKVMYQFDMGQITKERIQSTTSWTMSDATLGSMFEVPQAYLQPAPAAGQKGYQYFASSSRYGHLLPVGTSVLWTQMKGSSWIRPDLASEGTSRANPSYKVTFTPRLYTNQTDFIDHNQCVFFYVRFCGDGTVDSDRGEVCDDGNMTNGDGCSNICQPELPQPLTCDNLTLAPATLTQSGGTITATCAGTNETQYKFVLKKGATIIGTRDYQVGASTTFSIPSNNTTGNENYSVACYVKNNSTTDVTAPACEKPLAVPGVQSLCTNLAVTPLSLTNGGTVNYTCTGSNVSSYSVVFTSPNGGVLQTLNTATGSVSIPATPLGNYNVACYVNGSSSTPPACTKSFSNTTTSNPVCENLALSQSGNTVNYSCIGSGGITSYTIRQNGNVISNNSSGSVTLSTPGTYTFDCFVNGTITSNSCQKSITINENITPEIEVIKDDNDNHDDTQFVSNGGEVAFSIRVRNPGTEALENVTLNDPLAPECNRSASQTRDYIENVGNHDSRLDPGESFVYVCQKRPVYTYTFTNNRNTVCVYGRGYTSQISVDDCDDTRITFQNQNIVCQNMNVSQNGDDIRVNCGPSGRYRLTVTKNGQSFRTLNSTTGSFQLQLANARYQFSCMREDESYQQPACQKNITVRRTVDKCILEASETYGGSPLRTTLECSSQQGNSCQIDIFKDGVFKNTINNCNANLRLTQRGSYEAICHIAGTPDSEKCRTRIQVDIMTRPPTGPIAGILVTLLAATGITYYIRRRKKA